jgi:hypothetical protein
MRPELSSILESLQRLEHTKSIDPFFFVALQRAFFDHAIEELEKNNAPEIKKSILGQLEVMEKLRDKILSDSIHNLPPFTQSQIEILDSQMQKCVLSYNRMQTLLKTSKRKTKSRLYG